MDISKIEDLRRLHEDFTARVGEQVDRLKAGEAAAPEAMLSQRRELLRHAEARLRVLRDRRERLVRDLDAEIQSGERAVEELRADLSPRAEEGGEAKEGGSGRRPRIFGRSKVKLEDPVEPGAPEESSPAAETKKRGGGEQ